MEENGTQLQEMEEVGRGVLMLNWQKEEIGKEVLCFYLFCFNLHTYMYFYKKKNCKIHSG